jgi:hypothetical protein
MYPGYAVSDKFGLGLRGEYFIKQGSGDTSLTALTLSANLKSGGLTFIPEFRLDNNADKAIFVDSASLPATSASSFTSSCLWF